MEEEGASAQQQLMHAARTDSEALAESVLNGDSAKFDINATDGLGMTALHTAAASGSPSVLELLLECEGCDVDLQTNKDQATPLHCAAKLADEQIRGIIIRQLLDAGADPRIKNRYKQRPGDLLPPLPMDKELRDDLRRAEAEFAIANEDIVDDDDIASGSGSD